MPAKERWTALFISVMKGGKGGCSLASVYVEQLIQNRRTYKMLIKFRRHTLFWIS